MAYKNENEVITPERSSKRFEDLTFTDDFMFCKVLQNDLQLCQDLLSLIIGKKVGILKSSRKQEPIEITPDGRGIRLDVFTEDDENNIFNVEMQNKNLGDLPKRSRYYQAARDIDLLTRGAKFNNLKTSYVIFINMFDPFERNYYKYTFRNKCDEISDLNLDDGTIKIFLNAQGNSGDVSNDMKEFLEYLCGAPPKNSLTRRIEDDIERARSNKDWEVNYMLLQEHYEIAREEGRQEGRTEGRRMLILDLVSNGELAPETGARKLDMTQEEFDAALKKYIKNISN